MCVYFQIHTINKHIGLMYLLILSTLAKVAKVSSMNEIYKVTKHIGPVYLSILLTVAKRIKSMIT